MQASHDHGNLHQSGATACDDIDWSSAVGTWLSLTTQSEHITIPCVLTSPTQGFAREVLHMPEKQRGSPAHRLRQERTSITSANHC